MAAPKTRYWSARENVHQPAGLHLIVTGQVEVPTLNTVPNLTTRTSRDPKVLEMELTLGPDSDEPSGDAMVWRGANYHEVVKADQYSSVVIMWDDNVVARIDVVDDREHGVALAKGVQALNATAAKTIKLKPVKKPAAKKSAAPKPAVAKPAPKKAAPKKATPKKKAPAKKAPAKTKAAKKTAKKPAKKSAKKSAKKKSAKKSALTKFVRRIVKKLTPAKKKKKKKH